MFAAADEFVTQQTTLQSRRMKMTFILKQLILFVYHGSFHPLRAICHIVYASFGQLKEVHKYWGHSLGITQWPCFFVVVFFSGLTLNWCQLAEGRTWANQHLLWSLIFLLSCIKQSAGFNKSSCDISPVLLTLCSSHGSIFTPGLMDFMPLCSISHPILMSLKVTTVL